MAGALTRVINRSKEQKGCDLPLPTWGTLCLLFVDVLIKKKKKQGCIIVELTSPEVQHK
jgi:hypothetical protein